MGIPGERAIDGNETKQMPACLKSASSYHAAMKTHLSGASMQADPPPSSNCAVCSEHLHGVWPATAFSEQQAAVGLRRVAAPSSHAQSKQAMRPAFMELRRQYPAAGTDLTAGSEPDASSNPGAGTDLGAGSDNYDVTRVT
ncbi:hypothetical protein Dimus_000921 [Dionaea muscipula]